MAGASRVAWREGLFLRPQHFQQQDRFVEALVQARVANLTPHPWGLIEAVPNEGALQLGKFAMDRLVAILPDGAVVSTPGDSPPVTPIDVPPDTRDTIVYLTLPAQQAGALEFQPRSEPQPTARHLVDEEEVYDAYAGERTAAPLELGRPNLRFALTREDTDGRVTLALARISEVVNGKPTFDERFIPPCLDVRASSRLTRFIDDIIGRADQRVDELAGRAVQSAEGGAETFASFLLLQALNRWTPILHHLRSIPSLHPERLYETFVSMAGELATLVRSDRRAPYFAPYDHLNLQATFEPVFDLLQSELSAMFDRSAGQMELEQVGPGAYTARIDDHSLFQTASFYLAVSTRAPPEQILQRFASLVKVGSVVKMSEIVKSALQAGVRIAPTTTPPPQIRILPGYIYFELDRSSPDWRDLAKAPALGLHVAGDWPDLVLELWWVKRGR
jgi:type VI secretion system protein ImpJ